MNESQNSQAIEVPMTAELSARLSRVAPTSWVRIAVQGGFLLLIGWAGVVRLLQGQVDAHTVLFAPLALVVVFFMSRNVWLYFRDMGARSAMQLTGELLWGDTAHNDYGWCHSFTVADSRFEIHELLGSDVIRELATLSQAAVVFTKRQRIVIEIRGPDGRWVYQLSHYQPN